MQQTVNVIRQFLETPFKLDGQKATSLLNKQRRRRRRRASSPESGAEDDEVPRRRKEKKKKETKQYKSAQFIEDSDAEYGDMEAFLEKEKALREKTARLAAASGQTATMRSRGTKKRRRRSDGDNAGKRKRKRRNAAASHDSDGAQSEGSKVISSGDELDVFGSPKQPISTADTTPDPATDHAPKARPRPRPAFKGRRSSAEPESPIRNDTLPATSDRASSVEQSPLPARKIMALSPSGDSSDEDASELVRAGAPRKKGRLNLILSDDDD